MTTKKSSKPRKTRKPKKVTPCVKCKAFTVTPARNSRGLFVATKAKQKAFRF